MIVFPIANVVTIIMNNRVVVMMVFIVLPFMLDNLNFDRLGYV